MIKIMNLKVLTINLMFIKTRFNEKMKNENIVEFKNPMSHLFLNS